MNRLLISALLLQLTWTAGNASLRAEELSPPSSTIDSGTSTTDPGKGGKACPPSTAAPEKLPPLLLPETPGPLSPAQLQSVIDRLKALQKTTAGFHALFDNRKETILSFDPVLSSGEIAVLKPDTFYKKVAGKDPVITYLHGDSFIIYFPRERKAERYFIKGNDTKVDTSLLMACITMDFDILLKRFKVSGEKENNGLVRLDFQPLKEDDKVAEFFSKVSVWTDCKSPWPLSVQTENPDGDVSRDTYKKITLFPDEKTIPRKFSSLLRFTLPPRTRIVEPASP